MTTALLIIIVLIELARLALQYRSGKTYAERQEKTYCTAVKVWNVADKVPEEDLKKTLDVWANGNYEIATVTYSGFNKSTNKHYYTLFFTKKRIKSFEEK